jgi:drug/metabolite transporter (DMT)-like permease
MTTVKHIPLKSAYMKMHLAIFLWGFTGLFGKLISLNEGMLVWYRLLVSSAAIAILLLYRKSFPKISLREIIRISGIGILVMLHWVTFYGSIKLASISVAMICLSSIALFVSFIEPLFNRQRFDKMEILFSAFAVLGIFFIYKSDISASAGIIVGITSALLSAIFSTLNKKITHKYEPLTISLIELTSGFLFLTLLLPVYFRIQPTEQFFPSAMDSVWLMILSLVCTVFTWVLSLQAMRKVSAFTVALALNLEPVYGIILAILFAGEAKILNTGFFAGGALIMLTVVAHAIYKYRKSKQMQSNEPGIV